MTTKCTASLLPHILSKKFKERFWSKVEIKGVKECWPWKAGKHKFGYGIFNCGRTTGKLSVMTSHRLAWIIHHGSPVNSGLCILHKCDNPCCCNPNHLTMATQSENVRDMDSKGRRANGPSKGESHGMSKLTNKMILAIRASYASGGLTASDIANLFNISATHVSYIVHRKVWKHI